MSALTQGKTENLESLPLAIAEPGTYSAMVKGTVSKAWARLDQQLRQVEETGGRETERVSEGVQRARAFINHLSRREVMMKRVTVAIDQLPQIRETHGHGMADFVLKCCAKCLVDSVRADIDWLARYGEDEFVVVLPETDAAGAVILAKRLRIRIASTPQALTSYP